MTQAIKALLLSTLALLISGCASTGMQSKAPIQISIAPAIDVPYAEVIRNIPEHIGVNLRWGGQIIGIKTIEKLTRLTVLAYPLNAKGQPHQKRVWNRFR
ncbi:MAG: starvation-inducible outer membrane lipoprotein [Arenicella sp.]|jgi:starvation-inducible outer membrane lipoprotein